MRILRAQERGATKIDWLESYHSFSFGDYYNPEMMGFRTLRVINDDIVAPAQGFGMHGHRDMEIITLMLEGTLAHRDSLGHEEHLRPGEVQVMTAGRGIRHSEFNPSEDEAAHLLQIWVMPERQGLEPAYAQKSFAAEDKRNRLVRVAGKNRGSSDSALAINQDADVFLTEVEDEHTLEYPLQKGRGLWVHLIRGGGVVNEQKLHPGDAAALEDGATVRLSASGAPAEFVLFDVR